MRTRDIAYFQLQYSCSFVSSLPHQQLFFSMYRYFLHSPCCWRGRREEAREKGREGEKEPPTQAFSPSLAFLLLSLRSFFCPSLVVIIPISFYPRYYHSISALFVCLVTIWKQIFSPSSLALLPLTPPSSCHRRRHLAPQFSLHTHQAM